ncbi:MAG: hypothetical protein CMJ18_12010 [Phycisphaeraceae bacterium]|nr:hypothetical protein [Phycisphaeraceae bacterium]
MKQDLILYDRPGWNSFTYNFPVSGGIRREPDGAITIRFDSADASCINDDFYFEHYRQVAMRSRDCLAWENVDPDWDHYMPMRLSDGTLVQLIEDTRLLTRKQQKARLDALGIGHVWRDDCELTWQLWPEQMTDEFKQRGVRVWDRPIPPYGDGPGQRWLPEGVVAMNVPSSVISRVSTDNGRNWHEHEAQRLDERHQHFGTGFASGLVLADDTILAPCYVITQPEQGSAPATHGRSHVHMMRSIDRGCSFEVVPISEPQPVELNETSLVQHPSGSVVALIRSGDWVHCSISEDRGATWSTPAPTPMTCNAPLHAICLRSGAIFCAHAYRLEPGGMRGALSDDGGRTWTEEMIIRDDAPANDFIGGPGLIQLDDDRIFMFYSLVRNEPGDPAGRPHCYVAGSIFTEQWMRGSTKN